MYRPRRSGDLRNSFTFGGRIPASVGLLLVLVAVATVGSWLARDLAWAALVPGVLRSGQLWRLVTWPLVQEEPMALIFGGLTLYFFGPQLAYDWGEGRFLWTNLVLTLGSAFLTLLVAALLGVGFSYVGIWPLVDGLILLWALRYQDQQILLFFVLPVTGRLLALITVATNALFLLWGVARFGIAGLVQFTPPVAALLIAWVLTRTGLRLPLRRWKLAWRDFRLERQMRRRSRHLKVVRKNGQDEPPRWLN